MNADIRNDNEISNTFGREFDRMVKDPAFSYYNGIAAAKGKGVRITAENYAAEREAHIVKRWADFYKWGSAAMGVP